MFGKYVLSRGKKRELNTKHYRYGVYGSVLRIHTDRDRNIQHSDKAIDRQIQRKSRNHTQSKAKYNSHTYKYTHPPTDI